MGVDDRAGGERTARCHQNGVAIGVGFRDEFATNAAPRAATVLDDDDLPQYPAETVGDDARHTVGRAARRKRHHHLDGLFARIRLCLGGVGAAKRACDAEQGRKKGPQHHGDLPDWSGYPPFQSFFAALGSPNIGRSAFPPAASHTASGDRAFANRWTMHSTRNQ